MDVWISSWILPKKTIQKSQVEEICKHWWTFIWCFGCKGGREGGRREVRTFGEVEGVAALGEEGELLDGRGREGACAPGQQVLRHSCKNAAKTLQNLELWQPEHLFQRRWPKYDTHYHRIQWLLFPIILILSRYYKEAFSMGCLANPSRDSNHFPHNLGRSYECPVYFQSEDSFFYPKWSYRPQNIVTTTSRIFNKILRTCSHLL